MYVIPLSYTRKMSHMKCKWIGICCLLGTTFWLGGAAEAFAQNLVKNPGFEFNMNERTRYHSCAYMKHQSNFNRKAKYWTTFRGLTPDLIEWKEGCPMPKPHRGRRMVGVIAYHPAEDTGFATDYHELIQGSLKNPLIPGTTYHFSFWILQSDSIAVHHLSTIYGRPADIYPTATDNIGLHFSPYPLSETADIANSIETFDIQPQYSAERVVTTPGGTWLRISGSFVAREAHEFFLFGAFKADVYSQTTLADTKGISQENVNTPGFWDKKKRIAYYLLDDFYVGTQPPPALPAPLRDRLRVDRKYTFQNLLFETGNATLLPASFVELDQLIQYLHEQPDTRLRIVGHTDNQGSPESNLQLSENRARAVYEYLISRKIAVHRLRYEGKGETHPVADNATDSGRAQNRRVEVLVE